MDAIFQGIQQAFQFLTSDQGVQLLEKAFNVGKTIGEMLANFL